MITFDLLQRLVDKYCTEKGCRPDGITYHWALSAQFASFLLGTGGMTTFNGVGLYPARRPEFAPGFVYCGLMLSPPSDWVSVPISPDASSAAQALKELMNLDISNLGYLSAPHEKHTHSWSKYVGFTDSYEYCECGEKR